MEGYIRNQGDKGQKPHQLESMQMILAGATSRKAKIEIRMKTYSGTERPIMMGVGNRSLGGDLNEAKGTRE